MHDLNLIACVSQDGGLGRDGKLLWQIPEDMQFFKRATMGHPVIMGRKTFQSIGRALPGRDNIVLSRTKGDQHNITWCNATELDTWISSHDGPKFIVGGTSLYQKFLPLADVLYLTEVAASRPADTYFPDFDRNAWRQEVLQSGIFDNTNYQIIKYTRKG